MHSHHASEYFHGLFLLVVVHMGHYQRTEKSSRSNNTMKKEVSVGNKLSSPVKKRRTTSKLGECDLVSSLLVGDAVMTRSASRKAMARVSQLHLSRLDLCSSRSSLNTMRRNLGGFESPKVVSPSDDKMHNAVFERRETASISIRTSCELLSRRSRISSRDSLPRLPSRLIEGDRPPQMIRRTRDDDSPPLRNIEDISLLVKAPKQTGKKAIGNAALPTYDAPPAIPRRCDSHGDFETSVVPEDDPNTFDGQAMVLSAVAEGRRRAMLDSLNGPMPSSATSGLSEFQLSEESGLNF